MLQGSVHDKIPIEVKIKVKCTVYSQHSKIIYCTDGTTIQGYIWENGKSALKMKVASPGKKGKTVESIAMAPRQPSSTVDSLYLSIGSGDAAKKSVSLISELNFNNETPLELHDVKEKCKYWEITSDPDKNILIVHPSPSTIFYVYSLGKLKETLNLAECGITNQHRIDKMQLIDNKLFLGNKSFQNMRTIELVLDDAQCVVAKNGFWGPISAYYGAFAALKLAPNTKDLYIISQTEGTIVSAFKHGVKNIKASVMHMTKKQQLYLIIYFLFTKYF